MGYYDGVMAFKDWKRKNPVGYDWADLSDEERAVWAEREKNK